jgi:hypothetical protein
VPHTVKECEVCGEGFTLLHGRGANNRVACYVCSSSSEHKPNRERNKNLKRSYGLTLFGFSQLYLKQAGCCAICSRELSFKGVNARKTRTLSLNEPCVDHCHETGKARGILCHSCNVSLGHTKDNVVILQRMIDYIQVSKEN